MKLKVSIGCDAQHTQIAWVNYEGRPTEVDGPLWVGRILVRVRDFDGFTPDGSPPKRDSEYFRGRSRKFQIQAEGRFKKEYNGDQVIYGTQFDHMISTFPESAFRAGMRIAKYIDPAVYYDKYARSPYIMSPFVACVNTLSAWPAPSRLEDAVISLVEADSQESDTESLPEINDSSDVSLSDLPSTNVTPKKTTTQIDVQTNIVTPPITVTAVPDSPNPPAATPATVADNDDLSIVSSDSGNTTAPRKNRHRYWSFAGFSDSTRFSHLNVPAAIPDAPSVKTETSQNVSQLSVKSAATSLAPVEDDEDDELLLHRHITNKHKDFNLHVKQLGLLHKPSLDLEEGYIMDENYGKDVYKHGISNVPDDENEDDLQRYFTALEMQQDQKEQHKKSKNKDPFRKITHPSLHLGKFSTPKLIKRMSLRSKKSLRNDSKSDDVGNSTHRFSTASAASTSAVKTEKEKKMSAPRRSLDKLIRIGSLHRHHHHHHKTDLIESDSGIEASESNRRKSDIFSFSGRNSFSVSRPSSSHSTLSYANDSASSAVNVAGETGSLPPLREQTSITSGVPPSNRLKKHVSTPEKIVEERSIDEVSQSNTPSSKQLPQSVDGKTVTANANSTTVAKQPTSNVALTRPKPVRTATSQSKIPKPVKHIPSDSNNLDPQLGPWRFANPKVDPIEDNSFIFGEHKSVKERRKYFSSSKFCRENFFYDKDVVYCMSFFSPHMDFNTFNLNIGPIRLNVYKHLNSDGHQPIRYMMRETDDEDAVMFVVEFDLLEDDDETVLAEQAKERERRKQT
ncbi:DUF1769 family protein [Schizosaccharomyces pombe]|uniref:DUF1769 family protein duc1 n=1 Tax=Schizosaccharomyces pombe (strain 972 / ATCC 24843) TaxID=284812 RepID=DUC1_SCHPO|nr:uncharacterized protein SPCC594.01 [Schizosaccharomyces pombe]O74504.2 RecName: Full=UPF0590 protein C594.01 [Schizosaccharomyces pombe 972h-]CAA19280.2 DUF1769 family protein [Schizosaccharomyces pombe]|eukprot:NP_001342730.1 uncharacterized protein SPCC594.01 [Schizosaccharomyces pombe]